MTIVNNIKALKNYCENDLDLKDEWGKLVKKAVELEQKSDEIATRHVKTNLPTQDVDYKQMGQLLTNFLESRALFIERCKGRGVNIQFHIGSCTIYAIYKESINA